MTTVTSFSAESYKCVYQVTIRVTIRASFVRHLRTLRATLGRPWRVTHPEVDVSAVASDARRVLQGNRQRGVSEWDGRSYDFVCPSPQTYPFQWLWDSAFHAIALLCVDPELAKQELRCLLQGAQPDGFIPHMLLWEKKYHPAALSEYSIVLANPFYTATVQPPVIARAVWRVYQATKDRQFLLDVLPAVTALLPLAQGVSRPRRRPPDRDHSAGRVGTRRQSEVRRAHGPRAICRPSASCPS